MSYMPQQILSLAVGVPLARACGKDADTMAAIMGGRT